jgi:hypothetical protein
VVASSRKQNELETRFQFGRHDKKNTAEVWRRFEIAKEIDVLKLGILIA